MKEEIITKEIPLSQIESDPDRPRKELGVDEDDKNNRLLLSMQDVGLLDPIAVRKIGKDKYRIIHGERRFLCATLLKWESILCNIHPVTDEGDAKRIRYDLENNNRRWRAPERSHEVKAIKDAKNLKTAKEVADLLHVPEGPMVASLELQKMYDKYEAIMNRYKLQASYREEFIRLEPRIWPIREFTKEKIIENLFERVEHQVIRNAKDFVRLRSAFGRAHTDEKEIYAYLSNLDMKVGELMDRMKRDIFVQEIEKIIRDTTKRLSEGGKFPPEVRSAILRFRNLLNKNL